MDRPYAEHHSLLPQNVMLFKMHDDIGLCQSCKFVMLCCDVNKSFARIRWWVAS